MRSGPGGIMTRSVCVPCVCVFFFVSHLLSWPFFSVFLTRVRALPFYREKMSALSSLVDSRRIASTHARLSQQLVFF